MTNNILGCVGITPIKDGVEAVIYSDRCPCKLDYCHAGDTNVCPHFSGLDTVDYTVFIHCNAAEKDDLEL